MYVEWKTSNIMPNVITCMKNWQAYMLLMCLVPSVSGLECLQCTSIADPDCSNAKEGVKPCVKSDHEAGYCMKSVGTEIHGHGEIVFRSCSNTNQTNCTEQNFGDSLYRVCHYSCTEKGCNGAESNKSNSLAVILLYTLPSALFICARQAFF